MTDQPGQTGKNKQFRSISIAIGVILLVALVAVFKNTAADKRWLAIEPVAKKLNDYRALNQPVVVFFHSPDCSSCNQVQASLEEIYPEFEKTVALLDVDVTNQRERELVERTNVQTTPTLLLVDAEGDEKLIVGEIIPADLRAELIVLAGGAP